MKNKIAFIAVGQAGGNIGKIFEEKGYSVLYMNTSKEDLNTLTVAKYKYHITGGEGCNHDRKKAKQLVIDDFDNIAFKIDNTVNAELVYVIFASGGGTGSGAGPMLCDLLIDDGRTVGAITVIPAKEESVKAHINSYECFQELTKIDGLASCFVMDNDNGDKIGINDRFVNDFCDFLSVPDTYRSVKGNIDKAEVMETLKSHGMAIVTHLCADESAEVINWVKNSTVFAPMESDRTVKYIAACLSGDVCISDMEMEFGTPMDTFSTFNDDGDIICCISGLSYPVTRLEQVYDKVEANKDVVVNNIRSTHSASLSKDVNFLDGIEQQVRKSDDNEKKPMSRRSIMSKYL